VRRRDEEVRQNKYYTLEIDTHQQGPCGERCLHMNGSTGVKLQEPRAVLESPPLPPNPYAKPKPTTYMADAARDNLDQGLAMPRRLDGDLSHIKAVPVVVRHACEHGVRQRVGSGSGGSHCWCWVEYAVGGRLGEADAVVWYGRRARGVSKWCMCPDHVLLCVVFF
jgi:hypothetical protein